MLPFVHIMDFHFFFNYVGVGGYTYLLEPLWWAGMVLSKYIGHHCKLIIFSVPVSLK